MSALTIREVAPADRNTWLAMYRALFPKDTERALLKEIDRIYADPSATAFLAFLEGAPVGFAEYALRPHANGCHSTPVPFLEGIWVAPGHRRHGIGTALLAHLEAVARAAGHREMGSDVLAANRASQVVHGSWGFEETERVIFYRKDL